MSPTNQWAALVIGVVALGTVPEQVNGQAAPDPQYQTRASQCHHTRPTGPELTVRRADSGIRADGYTAERLVLQNAEAANISGGDILVCTEYGSVEIADSDDDQVRLQVRVEGFGEGSEQPAEAAARVIRETELHTFIGVQERQLVVRVWHSTLGFTQPGSQPAWVNVRLQVPAQAAYRIRTEAFHGQVAIRRLTLAGATLRGAVGYKLKGIPGFKGGTELDNVVLAGDVDIDNLGGIPGIRPPSPRQLAPLAAPVLVKARVTSTCRMVVVTGGSIDIAVQPHPGLGVRALGESNEGQVRVGVEGSTASTPDGISPFRTRQLVNTTGFDAKPVRVDIRASSGPGNVSISSIPAAPLHRNSS